MLQDGIPFGPYRVCHRLGAGAMGDLYLAFDSRLQRDVAMKVLSDSMAPDYNTAVTLEAVR